ncbi:hypothetical protein SK128_001316, partial [Halocaridina rubra]
LRPHLPSLPTRRHHSPPLPPSPLSRSIGANTATIPRIITRTSQIIYAFIQEKSLTSVLTAPTGAPKM